MKINAIRILQMTAIAFVSAVMLVGCKPKSNPSPQAPGIGERTGAAIDRATEKTTDAAKSTAETAKDVAGQAVEKTGEVLKKAGKAVEKTGTNMQQ